MIFAFYRMYNSASFEGDEIKRQSNLRKHGVEPSRASRNMRKRIIRIISTRKLKPARRRKQLLAMYLCANVVE